MLSGSKGLGCNTGHQEVAGVTQEVDVRIKQGTKQVLKPWADITRNPKTGAPVALQKGLISSRNVKKVKKTVLQFLFFCLKISVKVKFYLWHSVSGPWASCTRWARTRKENPGNSEERSTSQNKNQRERALLTPPQMTHRYVKQNQQERAL